MFSESRFSDLTESLASGFFADKVVLAIARFQKSRTLNPSDELLLEEAVQFFKKVIEGHDWMDNPRLSKNSMESATAFSQAVRARSPHVSSKNFVDYIQDLLNTANQLLQQKTADQNKIAILREFFSNYGRSELVRTENLLQDDRLEIFQ